MIHADRLRRPLVIGAVVVAFVSLSLLIAFSVPLTAPLTDLFQEGEYLTPRLFAQTGHLPLLIHGLIDVWPSEIAAWACGEEKVIHCTRSANAALTALASSLFAACAFAVRGAKSTLMLAAGGAILTLLLINGQISVPIALQQGSPAIRDIVLLAELICLSQRTGRTADLGMVAAGALAAAGVFWTYNRGLIGVVAILVGVLACFAVGCRRQAVIGGVAFAATLVLILLAFPVASGQHFANIVYWARHGDVWAYPDPVGRLRANASFYTLACLTLAVGALAAWRQRRSRDLPTTMVLLVVAAMLLQQIHARDDSTHMLFVVPWLFLLALRAFGATLRARDARALGIVSLALAGGVGAVMVAPLYAGVVANREAVRTGRFQDSAIVPMATRQAAAMLRRAPGGCTYVLDNSQALYSLAGKLPCSRVIVPIYAQDEAETALIADLYRTRPAMIMGLSQDWFSAIDGRPLASRTPRLAAWINAHYVVAGRVDARDVLVWRSRRQRMPRGGQSPRG